MEEQRNNSCAHIYILIDPRSGEIRYVGVTRRSLLERLGDHLRDYDDNHRVRWISSLRRGGLTPSIGLVQSIPLDEWANAERYWIEYFRNIGCALVNSTDGGKGSLNPSIETRSRMSLAHRGKTLPVEQRAKISETNTGRKMTTDQIAKIKAWQIHRLPISEKTRLKLRAAKLGRNISEQHREKIGLALRGRSKSEETKAKMKAAWIIRRSKNNTNA